MLAHTHTHTHTHTHNTLQACNLPVDPSPVTNTGGRPKAYVQYGFGPPVEAAVTDLGNGKYTLRFVPPNEGEMAASRVSLFMYCAWKS